MASTALDRLRSLENLRAIWKEYWRHSKESAPGIDGITPKGFNDNLPSNLSVLRAELADGYDYFPLRGVAVPKKDPAKKRLICIPTVRDRVVQRAVLRVIEARGSKLGIVNGVSFGFIKDSNGARRGAHAALNVAVQQRRMKPWAFKADIAAFFDRIPREQLLLDFNKAFRLTSLSSLLAGAINCEVDGSDPFLRRVLEDNGIETGRGLRQGMPLSPILSNFLLRDFDRAFSERGYAVVRYADDFVAFASSRNECEAIKYFAEVELAKLKLQLNPEKTEICAPEEPIEFLGMELGPKDGTSRYCLTVSSRQIEKIKESFRPLHDLDFVMSKGLDLARLSGRLDHMKTGYRIAYGVADNFAVFDEQLDRWAQNCALKIFSSIFGAPAVDRLTLRQKTFLMLPGA
jgi:retron-type reverse transcriptase